MYFEIILLCIVISVDSDIRFVSLIVLFKFCLFKGNG